MSKCKGNFFPTWQEASEACRKAGLRKSGDYEKKRSEIDPHLPSNPYKYYPDWPGWRAFLYPDGLSKFATWQQASEVARLAGIGNEIAYKRRYKSIDSRLPSCPNCVYADWPGWSVFFGRFKKDIYPTWQEAAEVCRKANIKNGLHYYEVSRELDARLPSRLDNVYSDWPGWKVFLQSDGKRALRSKVHLRAKHVAFQLPDIDEPNPDECVLSVGKFYETWQQASLVCMRAGIQSQRQYFMQRRQLDCRLPGRPESRYVGWPGWKIFLNGEGFRVYATWQEASVVCLSSGIKSQTDYHFRYAQLDPRLPSSPNHYYKDDWPGWGVFLGRKKADWSYIASWQEAAAMVRPAGFKNQYQYCARYKDVSDRLPGRPDQFYDNWPGWKVFLGTDVKSYYATWQEASDACEKLGIKSKAQYSARDKSWDPRLPNYPNIKYKDWPGSAVFFKQKKKELYPTWQQAGLVCQSFGIKSQVEYYSRYKELDCRLPGNPPEHYKDWPGWMDFLGKKRRSFYPTWQEAAEAVKALNIRSNFKYRTLYKNDPRLSSNPYGLYSDWPGWKRYLGRG
ncbi:MAG: integrase repeat-containing protein [Candidatus Falkowbacteria bacterium]